MTTNEPKTLYSCRLENTSEGHNKYYAIHVVDSRDGLFRVFSEYGKIGNKPAYSFSDAKGLNGTKSSEHEALRSANELRRNKMDKGYVVKSEDKNLANNH